MSNTEKTLTVTINSQLGNSVEALGQVEDKIKGTGVALKSLETIATDAWDAVEGQWETTYKYIARFTSESVNGLNKVKEAIKQFDTENATRSKLIVPSSLREEIAKEEEKTKKAAIEIDRRETLFKEASKRTLEEVKRALAVEKALQAEGANSITAIKAQQSIKEVERLRRLNTDLANIQKQFENKELTYLNTLSAKNAAMEAYARSILRLNQASQDRIKAIKEERAAEDALDKAQKQATLNAERMAAANLKAAQANRDQVVAARTAAAQQAALASSTEAIHTSTNNAARAVKGLDLSFSGLVVRAAEFIGIYRVLNTALNTVTNAIRSIPKVGIEVESTISSLSATLGQASLGSYFEGLTREAERTGMSITVLRENFRNFYASASIAGESTKDIWTMFTNLNTTATSLHMTADRVQLVFLAISQIFNKTKVQSEELVKQLGNLLPGAFAKFVEANKKSEETFKEGATRIVKSMQAGGVAATGSILKLTQAYADQFAGAFEIASQGFLANQNRMMNSFTLLGEAIYATTNGPLIGILKTITSLTEGLSNIVKGTSEWNSVLSTGLNVTIGITVAGLVSMVYHSKAVAAAWAFATSAVTALTAAAGSATIAMGYLDVAMAGALRILPVAVIAGLVALGTHLVRRSSEAKDLAENIRKANEEMKKTAVPGSLEAVEVSADKNAAVKEAKDYLDSITASLDKNLNIQKKYMSSGTILLSLEKDIAEQIRLKNTAEETYLELRKRVINTLTTEATLAKEQAKNNTEEAAKFQAKQDAATAKADAEKAKQELEKKLAAQYANISREAQVKMQELQTAMQALEMESARESEKTTKESFARRYELATEYYTKAKELQEQLTGEELQGLFNAKYLAEANNQIEKIQELQDKIDRIAGKVDENDPTKITAVGTAYLRDLEVETAYEKELLAIDREQLALKNQLLNIGQSANEVFLAQVEKLKNLYDSVDSTGKRILSDLEYAKGLTEANKKYNKNIDTEDASKNMGSVVPAVNRYYEGVKKLNTELTKYGNLINTTNSASIKGASQMLNIVENLTGTYAELVANRQKEEDAYLEAGIKIQQSKYDDEATRIEELTDLKIAHYQKVQDMEKEGVQIGIEGAMQVAGVAASMFDKRSKAAKALRIVEQSLALAALISQQAQTAQEVAALPVKGAGAVLNQGAGGDAYSAFARMAAMAALVASIIAGVGGMFGGTGKEVKIPRGTPTTGTVLGGKEDETSESVKNVMELLDNIHAEEYRELRGINKGVAALNNAITGTITNVFRQGGLPELKIDPKGAQSFMEKIQEKIPPLLSGLHGLIIGGLLGKTRQKVVGGGIEAGNISIARVLSGEELTANQYNTIQTTKKSWFSKKTKFSEKDTPLDSEIQESLTNIFRASGKLFQELSSSLQLQLEDQINNYIIPAFKVELFDLSGEDAVKALSDSVNYTLDTMAEAIFGSITKQYQQLGEGMLETVSRLAIDVSVVRDSFRLINVSFNEVGVSAIQFSESLITFAGSLEDLRGYFEEFADNFIEQYEKEILSYKDLAESLEDLNLILPAGRDGWKALVQSVLSGGNATAELAANLLKLTDAADAYYDSLDRSKDALLIGLFGEDFNRAKTIAYDKWQQELLLSTNPILKDAGLKAGSSTEQVQKDILLFLEKSNMTMDAVLAAIEQNPSLRLALDSFLRLADSISKNTPEDTLPEVKEPNQAARDSIDKFTTTFTALINKLTATLTVALTADAPFSIITDAVTATREAYATAVDDLNATYASITDSLRTKAFELQDLITTINNSLIKNAAQKAAADTALYISQKNRIYSELNKVVDGESAQEMYDRQIGLINNLQSLIQTRYDNEVSAIKEVGSAIDSIREHTKELLLNTELSPLSNAQRLSTASSQFTEVINAAKAGDKDALGKVNTALDAYLTEARGFYASSTDYQRIFNEAVSRANALTIGQQSTDQQIASATARAVTELQSLQSMVSSIEAKKAAELAVYQAQLHTNFVTLNNNFLRGIQAMINALNPNNRIDIGTTFGGESTNSNPGSAPVPEGTPGNTSIGDLINGSIPGGTTNSNIGIPGPVPGVASQTQLEHFNWLMDTKQYGAAARYGIDSGFTVIEISNYAANYSGLSVNEVRKLFADSGYPIFAPTGFASGGAFTNGIVQRPMAFNLAQMGENGSEGILPLANIGGKLGVYSNSGVSQELILELRELRKEVTKLREEQRQNTGDMIMSNYDAHSKTATIIVEETKESIVKKQWLEASTPILA